MAIDQRSVLERLIRERGADYASLSRLIGRNPAYVQQFIKRGVPRKLDEQDRQLLARYFGVSEDELGGPPSPPLRGPAEEKLIVIPRLDVGASAGPGADAGEEAAVSHLAFGEAWLRQLCRGRRPELSMIRVQGDSMAPTLLDGDDILVDRSDPSGRVRDGIYVLRRDDALLVKRLAISPSAGTVRIRSDNDAYPEWPECELRSIDVIGRVIWAGRRVS